MLDGISNSRPRTDTDDSHTQGVATIPTRYIELDVESIKTVPFTCADVQPKTRLFVDGIAPSDVRQGGVGDCTLQASLASLARTPAGRTYLQSNVRENRDEHGATTSYTVTLFKKSPSGAYERTQIDVPNVCLGSRGFAHAVDRDGAVEVWPRVYEQAMLKANNGVACTNMPEAMSVLTGKPAVDIATSDAHLSGKLARGFGLGKVQVLSTTGRVTANLEDPKLKPAHAYTLVGVEARPVRQSDGSYQVEELYVLRNPWGYDNPRPMTIDEVKKYFSTYSEGDVP
jgi:hypothetical protein